MTVKNDSGQTVKWLLTKKALEERTSIGAEHAHNCVLLLWVSSLTLLGSLTLLESY
jgi:hypothetical protein